MIINQRRESMAARACMHVNTHCITISIATLLLYLGIPRTGSTILLSAPTFSPCPPDGPLGNCTTQLNVQAAINLTAEYTAVSTTATIRCIDRCAPTTGTVELPAATHSPNGQCPCPCDYALDEGCTCRDLHPGAAINITVNATPATAVLYNFTYAGVFNGKPYEVGLHTLCSPLCTLYPHHIGSSAPQ